MTLHSDPSNQQPHHSSLSNQSFSPWIRSQSALFVSQIAAVLAFVLWIGEQVYYTFHLGEKTKTFFEPYTYLLILDLGQVIFVSVFIAVLFNFIREDSHGEHRVRLVFRRLLSVGRHETIFSSEGVESKHLEKCKLQLRRFKNYFLYFWIGMLLLYMAFACTHGYARYVKTNENKEHTSSLPSAPAAVNPATPISPTQHIGESLPLPEERILDRFVTLLFPFTTLFFNLLNGYFLFLCFLELYYVPSPKSDDNVEKETEKKKRKYDRYYLGLLTLFLVSYFLFALRISTPDLEGKLVFLNTFYNTIAGISVAVVMSLFIARLDSKLLGLRSWLISILYSYAAVQPLFAVFEMKSQDLATVVSAVLTFVFISKVYFFLIIVYALQTGRVLNYLFSFSTLKEVATDVDTGPWDALSDTEAIGTMSCLRRGKSWFSERALLLSSLFGGLSIFLFVLALAYFLINASTSNEIGKLPPDYLSEEKWWLLIFELVVVSIFICRFVLQKWTNDPDPTPPSNLLFNPSDKLKIRLKSSVKSHVSSLSSYFLCFWIATFALYLIFLLENRRVLLPFDGTDVISLYPAFELIVSVANLLCIFLCFGVLQSVAGVVRTSSRLDLFRNYSILVAALLIAVVSLIFFGYGGLKWNYQEFSGFQAKVFGFIGTLSGIVIALFAARIGSTWFRLPLWTSCILFFYSAIQALFIVFSQANHIFKQMEFAVLIVAFGLKISFFLVTVHIFVSGSLERYMFNLPLLQYLVESVFNNPYDIRIVILKENLFSICIYKKNKPLFSTNRTFRSRRKCDEFVKEMCKQLKEEEKYVQGIEKGSEKTMFTEDNVELGTRWLEMTVEFESKKETFESIALGTASEVSSLKAEALMMIPYCKYLRV